ncbi:MAG: SPOR domain-containing protein [Pseudomonadota bacterium]
MASSKNSAGIQIVGLTTASVFLMSFAFLMYRLERSAPVETDTRSHVQWRKSYLTPPKPRDTIDALIARRTEPKPPEPQEPDFDFYHVLPEFSVYVAPDIQGQPARVGRAPLQHATQRPAERSQTLITAAATQPAQPVIIQQQPVITYAQPVAPTALVQARELPQPPAPVETVSVDPRANTAGEWLQVGAFSRRDDASRRRAEVALLGLRAHIEPAVIRGSTVFRVKLGPFDDRTARSDANTRLTGAGIESIIKSR